MTNGILALTLVGCGTPGNTDSKDTTVPDTGHEADTDTDTDTHTGTDTGSECGTTTDADSDSDGLSDRQELHWGTDPNEPDSDGDGTSDGGEIALGTDPLTSGGSSSGDTGVAVFQFQMSGEVAGNTTWCGGTLGTSW